MTNAAHTPGPWIYEYTREKEGYMPHSSEYSKSLDIAICRVLPKSTLTLLAGLILAYSTVWASTITVGKPGQRGEDIFTVTDTNGRELRISVILDGTEDDKTKAGRLATALLSNGIRATPQGNQVVSNEITNLELKKKDNTTGESVKFSALSPLTGYIGYGGPITGLDINGFESVFQVSLGLDSTIVTSDLTFGALPNPGIDGLLTATFNNLRSGLPRSLQSDIFLDLDNSLIGFAFPGFASEGFVQNFTSDSTATISLGLTTVPEPAPLTTLGLGIFGILLFARVAKGMQRKAHSGQAKFGQA